MELSELETLRTTGAERNFTVHNQGVRGVVERLGFPTAPFKVVIRDIAGNAHHWDARDMSVSEA